MNNTAFIIIVIDGVVSFKQISPGCTVGCGGFMKHPDIEIERKYFSPIQGEFGIYAGRWSYIDHGKTMTLVNGKKMTPGNGVFLENGDILTIQNKTVGSDRDLIVFLFSTDPAVTHYDWQVYQSQDHQAVQLLKRGDDPAAPGIPYRSRTIIPLKDHILVHFDYPKPMISRYNPGCYESVSCSSPSFSKNKELQVKIYERRTRGQILLRDINLTVFQREMILILGGSGAGKTVFLNAVSGMEKAKAEILYNGINLYKNPKESQRLIGFVPQFNELRELDTVYKTLRDTADICYAADTDQKREHIVEKALKMFGLTDVRNNYVSKLSGGQKKRLGIAAEYITGPEIFLLDEPDSGLDANSSIEIMKQMSQVTSEGKICMVISHSPNRVIHYFNRILVLAKDDSNIGRLAFFGSIPEACEFFGVDNVEGIPGKINKRSEGGEGLGCYFIEKFDRKQNQ